MLGQRKGLDGVKLHQARVPIGKSGDEALWGFLRSGNVDVTASGIARRSALVVTSYLWDGD
jgi:hypothetical protein